MLKGLAVCAITTLVPFGSVSSASEELLRVVTLGTSLTLRGGWQDDLADRLRGCLGVGVSVDIVAKAGANSAWGLAAIAQVAETMPDVVVIEFSVNDADLSDGVGLAQSRANLAEMIAELQHVNPAVRIILPSMNPAFGWRAWTRPWLSSYIAVLPELANEPGVSFVDLYGHWMDLPDAERDRAIPDGLHPAPQWTREIIGPALALAIGGSACATPDASQ